MCCKFRREQYFQIEMGPNSIRHVLCGINFLFVLMGIILNAYGMENLFFYRHYGDLVQEQYTYISYFQIIIGVAMLLIAIVGWYGALAENSCVTLMYSSCLLLIFFLEISAAIGGYFLNITTHHSLTVSMRLPNDTDDYEMIYRWDRLQTDLSCCGIQKSSDWLNLNENFLPDSCCNAILFSWEMDECLPGDAHNLGCFVGLKNEILDNCLGTILLGFISATFQLMGIILTCYLSAEFRKDYQSI